MKIAKIRGIWDHDYKGHWTSFASLPLVGTIRITMSGGNLYWVIWIKEPAEKWKFVIIQEATCIQKAKQAAEAYVEEHYSPVKWYNLELTESIMDEFS